MSALLTRVPEIATATTAEQLAMIDELWELVLRSGRIETPESHRAELDRRVAAVENDPALALTPQQARQLFRR